MSLNASDLNVDTAAEYLRLVIPLMSRHKVPATPHNYAVWYTYVSGDHPALKAEIDTLIAENRPFTPALNAQLYRQFVSEMDLDNIERVRTDLSSIIQEVGSSLSSASNDAGAFEGTLKEFAEGVSSKDDLGEIRKLLETLVDETRAMRQTTNSLQTNFEARSCEVEELREQLQQERTRALTDPLTGLYNRFALMDKLQAASAEISNDEPLSIIMLDIDRFKSINDEHGHLIGDRVIRFVAQILQRNVKGQDTAARFGGEEFTVLLPSTPLAGAEAVADTIRKAVSKAQLVRADTKQPIGQITISAGVATFNADEDIETFIERADRALYQSKNDGRDRVSIAT